MEKLAMMERQSIINKVTPRKYLSSAVTLSLIEFNSELSCHHQFIFLSFQVEVLSNEVEVRNEHVRAMASCEQ